MDRQYKCTHVAGMLIITTGRFYTVLVVCIKHCLYTNSAAWHVVHAICSRVRFLVHVFDIRIVSIPLREPHESSRTKWLPTT